MHVRVSIHRSAENDLRAWVHREAEDEEREALIRLFVEELVRVLETQGGQIPAAERVGTGTPPVYWWRYTGEIGVQFLVRDERRTLFRGSRRRVIVTGFRPDVPPEGDE
jgi:hypothetical protein